MHDFGAEVLSSQSEKRNKGADTKIVVSLCNIGFSIRLFLSPPRVSREGTGFSY